MFELTLSTVFAQDGMTPLIGVSDLDLTLFQGQWHLFVTDRVQGNITSFHVLGAGGPVSGNDVQHISGGSVPAIDLDIIDTGSGKFAVLSGPSNASYSAYDISVSGNIEGATSFLPASGFTSALLSVAVTTGSGPNFMLTSQWGQNGFTVQSIGANQTVTSLQTIDVNEAQISDIELVEFESATIALVADAIGDQVLSYSVAADGSLTQVDTLGAVDGLGLNTPDILRVVDTAAQKFGLLASTGSSSISVFEITADGGMAVTDHVYDGLGTRFSAISELQVVEANDRNFVLAAGADDGISVLELLPDGRLLHRLTLEDTVGFPLQNVSGLAGQINQNVLHIFAGSASEAGLVELQFDLGDVGEVLRGSVAEETLSGGSGDDVIFGGLGAGNDELYGNDGDDVLIAGDGYDRLNGGSGADTFVFGNADEGRIDDFNVSQDHLDLSGWFLLYDVTRLDFTSSGSRVDIDFQGYSISVYSHDGSDLDAGMLADRIMINLDHTLITAPVADPLSTYTYTGTAENDELIGGVGLDVFYASAGADSYYGGENHDTVSFENFDTWVKFDLLLPDKNIGETADDTLISIEALIGSDFGDVLLGDLGQNWFEGGSGDDILRGRSARDRLFGGAGEDSLNGGKGRDRLEGGTGDDLLEGLSGHDFLQGGRDNDVLLGGDGTDKLYGGSGRDLLDGGDDADWLNGNDGHDTLSGGSGADEFIFGHGNDVITDFEVNIDTLYIAAELLSDTSMTVDQILAEYGEDLGTSIILTFGPDMAGKTHSLTLEGIEALTDLSDSFFLI